MARVLFSEAALLDLDAIEAYIAQDSPENASRFILQLDETCHLLGDMPLMGGLETICDRAFVCSYTAAT